MNRIALFKDLNQAKQVLCLGAHCDDIDIGAGGTLLRLQEEYPHLEIHWVVFSANAQRAAETKACAKQFIKNNAASNVVVLNFRESYFPYLGQEIKEYFDNLGKQYSPDLVLTHYLKDSHQDHRLISELTWNTFRHHFILEYFIPKYESEAKAANFFVSLPKAMVDKKVEAIVNHYVSQQDKHWFSKETFLATLRLHGLESISPSGYAEGFYARKVCY